MFSINSSSDMPMLPTATLRQRTFSSPQELDGGLDIIDLLLHIIRMGDHGRELASLVEARAEDPGDLLDQGVGAEEGVVALGKLLHLLLVLVQLLQIIC